MKAVLKRLIVDSQERPFPALVSRDIVLPSETKKVVSLIGVRRSGKTSILLKAIQQLRETQAAERSVYLNFEDDRLSGLDLSQLDLILEAYYELYPLQRSQKTYWFLDEIQNIAGWEKFVRRMHDTEHASIFLTGSSAKLLSSEIATSLRGRTISYEVFPFSFVEYLRFQKVTVNLNSSNSRSLIQHHFQHYLLHGGFAETFGETADIERRTLKDYLDLIIYRDVVDRFGVSNRALLKHLIKYVFANPATLISFNKLFNEFKSQGFKLSKDTLIEYFSYLNDAYAVFSAPVYRNSIHEEHRNPKKVYIIDNAYKQLFDAFYTQDLSKLYENLVFLQLRRLSPDIYYYKNKYEVDFFAQGQLINVSVSIQAPDTRQRELRALTEAMDDLNLAESWLLTADHEEEIRAGTKTIHVLPVWKWLVV